MSAANSSSPKYKSPCGPLIINSSGRSILTEIKRIGKFEVLERLLLDKILEEQELSLSDAFDEKTALRIGELYSVEALVTGSTRSS